MGISLGKTLLIAGGVGLAGFAAYSMFKPKEDPAKPEGTDPAGTGGAGGAGNAGGAPGATTPTAGTNPSGAAANGMPAGTKQVGPYTVMPIPNAPAGEQLVLETATQQPVGIMDAQGNVIPVTVDANGQLVPAQQQSTQSVLGPGTTSTTPTANTTTPYADWTGPTASTNTTSASGSYSALAKELFANASNPNVGSATSDAMTGTKALASGTPSAPVASSAPVGGTATSATSTSNAALNAYQVGEFTVIPDSASGMSLVLETASKQPVGIMDGQGNVTPVTVDANGQLQLAATTPAATATPATAATGAAPTTTSALG